MPQTIGVWVAKYATAKIIGVAGIESLTAAKLIYATINYATQFAVYAGASYATAALAIDTPSPDAAQGSMKQTIPPRIVAYGYGKLPAQLMLWEAKDNYAYDVGALNWGQVESIDEVWTHDHILNIGLDGWAIPSPETYGNGFQQIHVETRLGLPTETPYSNIVTALGPSGVWTNNHRGDGIASLGVDFHHDKKENLLDDYPNGAPSWSAVGSWSLIWDPRDDSHTASRNTGLHILDLLTRADGFNESFEHTIAPVLDHWLGELDICDEPIPLKAGGFVPRYESFVYRALSDDPQEALEKLLTACDGRLLMDENGCWKLWVGKYRAPTVFLTEEDIVGYDVAGDASSEDVVNELVPSFKSPAHKWNMVATDPWQDASDVEMRGKIQTSPMQLEAVTNNSQARRLAKREMSRLLSPLKGRLDCKLSADRACGERWVGIDFAELGLTGAVIEVEDGGQTAFSSLSVVIPFTLADPNADAWNAATEEGDGPQLTDRVNREALAQPAILDVTPFLDSIGGSDGTRLNIEATGPAREDITWSARWRVTGSSSWVEGNYVDIDPGSPVVLETGFVAADALEVQVAYTTGGGSLSPWSDTETVDATTISSVAAPSNLTASSPSAGVLRVGYRDPAQPVAYCIVRTNTSPSLTGATATPERPPAGVYTPQSVDLTRAAGSYYVWVTAYDEDDNPSADLGPAGPVTVA